MKYRVEWLHWNGTFGFEEFYTWRDAEVFENECLGRGCKACIIEQ